MTVRPPASDPAPRSHEIAILGNDMLLAALPARPVQLAHAIRSCGYDLVVPLSWGEELLAAHALNVLKGLNGSPGVFCSCPRVRERLLHVGPELASRLLSFVSPPVATARYLRALQPDAPMRITYFGACEGARDSAIDARVAPRDFLRHLDVSGIALIRQPSVFESVVPPDRRRHFSLPGGAPTSEQVALSRESYRLLTLGGHDLAAEIADRLMTMESVLIDVAPSLGCMCAGAVPGQQTETAREVIVALEPPRSALPVLDDTALDLDERLPSTTWLDRPRLVVEGSPSITGETLVEGLPGPWGNRTKDLARRRAERRRIAVTPTSVQPPLGAGRPGAELLQSPSYAGAEPGGSVPPGQSRTETAADRPTAPAPGMNASETRSGPAEDPHHNVSETTPGAVGAGLWHLDPLAVGPRSASPWSLARIATPPVARSALGLVPRAYAGKRRAAGSGAVAEVPQAAPLTASEPVAPEATEPAPPSQADQPLRTTFESESQLSLGTPVPVEAPKPEPATANVSAATPGMTAKVESPAAATPRLVAQPVDAVNEYVTVKERMSQRREHSRARRVPAVHESSGDRLWRLLAYVLLIAAIVIATLAIVRP